MNDGPSSNATDPSYSWWRKLTARFSSAPRTQADLQEMLSDARDDGIMDAEAADMIEGVFETRELPVRDIMVPRAQIIGVEREWGLDEIIKTVISANHSRYPVFGDTRDEIVGMLLAKDLLQFTHNPASFNLDAVMRPVVITPDARRVNLLLKEFRRTRNHMAIVADEYGGVAGLVTIEDILEQIVGEIDDEHDEAEGAHIVKQDDRRYLVNALTPIEAFNEAFNANFSAEDFDTVGGFVVHHFGHVPRRGESIKIGNFQFSVQRTDSRRVHLLQVLLAQD